MTDGLYSLEGREGEWPDRVGEGSTGHLGLRERHLQGVWADDRWRPKGMSDSRGRAVEVVHPGEWNTGAGPDFLNALVQVGGKTVHGDVEVHIRAQDWTRHGHGGDPRYGRVRFHVTYEEGTLPDGALPEGCVQIALKPALDAAEDFSFDNMDLTAYPTGARAEPPPCQAAMRALSPDTRGAVLEAAGEARLRMRAAVLRASMEDRGVDQVLWEETMAALGYRPNRAPMRRLARLVPLWMLREKGGGDVTRAYGLLMGCAGLLPDPTAARRDWDGETREFVRRCWDAWWGEADAFLGHALRRGDWTFSGIRPPNRPERRLMAAAMLFGGERSLSETLREWARRPEGKGATPEEMAAAFAPSGAPYWGRRLSWGGERLPAEVALVGAARAEEVAANLVVPAMAALGEPPGVWRHRAKALPGGEANALHAETALRLFGIDHSPRLYRSGLRRQGLIHIHHEYCLGDRSRCADCPVPGLLKGFGK